MQSYAHSQAHIEIIPDVSSAVFDPSSPMMQSPQGEGWEETLSRKERQRRNHRNDSGRLNAISKSHVQPNQKNQNSNQSEKMRPSHRTVPSSRRTSHPPGGLRPSEGIPKIFHSELRLEQRTKDVIDLVQTFNRTHDSAPGSENKIAEPMMDVEAAFREMHDMTAGCGNGNPAINALKGSHSSSSSSITSCDPTGDANLKLACKTGVCTSRKSKTTTGKMKLHENPIFVDNGIFVEVPDFNEAEMYDASDSDDSKGKPSTPKQDNGSAWKEPRNWSHILQGERVKSLHDKVMSPDRKKKTLEEMQKEALEKQERATRIRSQQVDQKRERLRRTSERVRDVYEWQVVGFYCNITIIIIGMYLY